MSNPELKILDQYEYEFPPELIARRPASPRDSARLLIFDRQTDQYFFDIFTNLVKYLPPKSVLVFNQTKVVPARLSVTKPTGGRVNLLYIATSGADIQVLANTKLRVGTELVCQDFKFKVITQEGAIYTLKPNFPIVDIFKVLELIGTTPLPPYIKNPELSEIEARTEYQTVFAREAGSVAAPTASLHFTPELLDRIKVAGHEVEYVTLHVNRGTFAPLTTEQLASGHLHNEEYEVNLETAERLNSAKEDGRPIVAVGTTVVRVLETAVAQGSIKAQHGRTDIFIREGYRFKFVDSLITNFHVPRSSLLMLVAAFAGRQKVLSLYREAIARGLKLFSFGDGMLIK